MTQIQSAGRQLNCDREMPRVSICIAASSCGKMAREITVTFASYNDVSILN